VSDEHEARGDFGRLGLAVLLLAGPLAVVALLSEDAGSSLAQVLYVMSFLWLVLGAPYLVVIIAIEIRDLAGHRREPSKDPGSCASAPPP
jgi:hypothetical protein